MAIQTFISSDNSTIWDTVLNTYGTVDDIVKLMQDNDFPNVNTYPVNGQVFQFDDTLVVNQNNLQTNLSNQKFATRDRTSTNDENMVKYEQATGINYTSNADGTTSISILELIGSRIVQIEKEIKPLETTEWTFNPNSGTITLVGNTLDNEQTLFIIYAKIITS